MTESKMSSLWKTSPALAVGDFSVDALWRHLLSSGGEANGRPSGRGLEDQQWVHIDDQGVPTMIAIDRHHLVRSLKLRYRDLAAVDPTLPLPAPSVILVRARAVAINLDVGGAIRIIICENQVFVLSVPKAEDPRLTALPTEDHPLVRYLCCCLSPPEEPCKDAIMGSGHGVGAARGTSAGGGVAGGNGRGYIGNGGNGPNIGLIDMDMPYELRALEVALSAALGVLTEEISAIEEWGYPAVDALLRQVDREGLEAVRLLKNAVDKLQGKVQRLVTELGDLLADDEDMCDLYLKRRGEREGLAPVPQPWEMMPGHTESDFEAEEDEQGEGAERERRRRRWKRRRGGAGTRSEPVLSSPGRRRGHHRSKQKQKEHEGQATIENLRKSRQERRNTPRGLTHKASEISMEGRVASSVDDALSDDDSDLAEEALEREEEEMLQRHASMSLDDGVVRVHPHEIEEAEDLLETMFERADMLLRRLTLLDERTNDTEDLLELELDQKRNQLVGLNLLVSSVSMAFGFAAAVGGIFGMNLKNEELASAGWVLALVLVLMGLGALLLVGFVVWYVRKRKLMFIPTTL